MHFPAPGFRLQETAERIDLHEPVSRSETRLAILLSLKLYDGITPPIDISFSNLRYRIRESDSTVPFSQKRFLVYKNKTLSFQTTQLINYFAAITKGRLDKIIKRQYNKLGITEQGKLRKIRWEIIKNIPYEKNRQVLPPNFFSCGIFPNVS